MGNSDKWELIWFSGVFSAPTKCWELYSLGFLTSKILELNPKVVGIYSLSMKKDSDNIRESSMQDVLLKLKKEGIEVVIYEPLLKKGLYLRCEVIRDFKIFATQSDLILTNRMNKQLSGQKNKIFTK